MSKRHFYDHGIINKRHRYLYAVENDIKNSRGCIGIYAIAYRYKRVGELSAKGAGPHQAICYQTTRHSLWLVVVCQLPRSNLKSFL
jgi:hypothetical protein